MLQKYLLRVLKSRIRHQLSLELHVPVFQFLQQLQPEHHQDSVWFLLHLPLRANQVQLNL